MNHYRDNLARPLGGTLYVYMIKWSDPRIMQSHLVTLKR